MDSHDPIPEYLMNKIRVMSDCDDVREIPGCPHYAVTSYGQVWSVKPMGVSVEFPKVPRKTKVQIYKGIPLVKLVNEYRKQVTYSLLKCVALAFIGLPPNADEWASPIDGDPTHVSPDNVEWISHSEVTRRSFQRHGGAWIYGEKQHLAKLTQSDVEAIRSEYQAGATQEELAEKYKVHRRTIGRAIRGTHWKQVDTPLPENSNFRHGTAVSLSKLDDDKVRQIRQLLKDGQSLDSIAQQFDVHLSAIWSIKAGKTWKHVQS